MTPASFKVTDIEREAVCTCCGLLVVRRALGCRHVLSVCGARRVARQSVELSVRRVVHALKATAARIESVTSCRKKPARFVKLSSLARLRPWLSPGRKARSALQRATAAQRPRHERRRRLCKDAASLLRIVAK